MTKRLAIAAALLSVLGGAPVAQSADRVRGTVVSLDAPVVMFAPGDQAMLVPGAHVIVQTQAATGGVLTAERVTVGKDGLVPPM